MRQPNELELIGSADAFTMELGEESSGAGPVKTIIVVKNAEGHYYPHVSVL